MPTPILPSRWVLSAPTATDVDVFPFLPGRGFFALKTPVWSGKTDTSVSGRSRIRSLWSYPIWRFRFGHEYLRDLSAFNEQQELIAFFNSKFGSAAAWFFLDPTDNAVTDCQFGVGDGVTQIFQMTRTLTVGGYSFTEPVRGFLNPPVIKDNGSTVSSANYTIGPLGKITFTTPPATGHLITWTGQFYFLCQFEKDELDLQQIMKGFWSSGSLDFRTFKP